MIAIIDYDTGNLRSVLNAFRRLGAEAVITGDHQVIRSASHVLLPGVGEASSAMAKLRDRGLDALIPTLRQPVLGICIGMQLMCLSSEEGDARCMGIFPTAVTRLQADLAAGIKVPHVGWDTVEGVRSPLFSGIADSAYFYYVHSYAAGICPDTIGRTVYGPNAYSAALGRENFYGVQFHPEKSGATGERLLSNFLTLS